LIQPSRSNLLASKQRTWSRCVIFLSQFFCLIKTATKAEEIFFQYNVWGGQTLWIARRETFIVPDYANITAEGNDCTVGCVEINT